MTASVVHTSSDLWSGTREAQRLKERRGPAALREFLNAPPEVRAEFWDRVQVAADSEHALDRHLAWLYSDAPDSEEPPPPTRLRPTPEWTKRWSRRARRTPAPRGNVQADDLRTITSREYVPELVGDEGFRIHCPLPDHDDHSRDFAVYDDEHWHCFGCNRSGDIFELAGALWGLDHRGKGFNEICARLGSIFGVLEKAA